MSNASQIGQGPAPTPLTLSVHDIRRIRQKLEAAIQCLSSEPNSAVEATERFLSIFTYGVAAPLYGHHLLERLPSPCGEFEAEAIGLIRQAVTLNGYQFEMASPRNNHRENLDAEFAAVDESIRRTVTEYIRDGDSDKTTAFSEALQCVVRTALGVPSRQEVERERDIEILTPSRPMTQGDLVPTLPLNPPESKPDYEVLENAAIALLFDERYRCNASKIAAKVGMPRTTLLSRPRFKAAYSESKKEVEQKKSKLRGGRDSKSDFFRDDDN